MASYDLRFFDGVVNGVEIRPYELNVNSLVRYVTLVQKYTSGEMRERCKEHLLNSFDDGIYLGHCEFDKVMTDGAVVEAPMGETIFCLRTDLRNNTFRLYSSEVDLSTNSIYQRYDKLCQVAVLPYPLELEVRFYDAKKNLISKCDATLNSENSMCQLFPNNETFFSYYEHRQGSSILWYLSFRNFPIILGLMRYTVFYNVMGEEPVSYTFDFDRFLKSQEHLYIEVEENKVLVLLVNIDESNGRWQLIISKNRREIGVNVLYYFKMYNRNDLEPLFINNQTVEIDVDCMDYRGFNFLSYEDMPPHLTGGSRILIDCYIGNNITYPIIEN